MYKIRINRECEIDVNQIYEVNQKRWGSIWVRWLDKNNKKRISKSRENIIELCCKINQFRYLEGLSSIVVKKD